MGQPTLQALLIADHVYQDLSTGKFVIAGTFSSLKAADFPRRFQQPVDVFVSMSNVEGEVPVSLRYVDVAEGRVLISTNPMTIESSHAALSIEFCLPIPGLPVPHPGLYRLELLANDVVLGVASVVVEQVSEQDGRADF